MAPARDALAHPATDATGPSRCLARAPRATRSTNAVPISSKDDDHVIMTRGKRGFRQPKPVFNLHTAPLSLVPRSYQEALTDAIYVVSNFQVTRGR